MTENIDYIINKINTQLELFEKELAIDTRSTLKTNREVCYVLNGLKETLLNDGYNKYRDKLNNELITYNKWCNSPLFQNMMTGEVVVEILEELKEVK